MRRQFSFVTFISSLALLFPRGYGKLGYNDWEGGAFVLDSEIMDLRERSVTKANELIQKSRFSLSAQQQKIVLFLISQINYWDEDFKLYTFSISEFCRVCGIERPGGKGYVELKAAIKEIADKSLWVRLDNGKQTLLRWIEKPYIDEGKGTVEIRLDKDMKPYLLQLRENFTKYELIYTLRFRSKYSIRLYELIRSLQYHDLEELGCQFTVEQLKALLDGEEYKEYRDFKRRVLNMAVGEVNRYSDRDVSYVEQKQGRKVTGVVFAIKAKSLQERLRLRAEIDKKLGPEQLSIWDVRSR